MRQRTQHSLTAYRRGTRVGGGGRAAVKHGPVGSRARYFCTAYVVVYVSLPITTFYGPHGRLGDSASAMADHGRESRP